MTAPFRLLAIDLGSRLVGWAYFEGADLVDAGTWNLEPPRRSSPGMKWLLFAARLDSLAATKSIDLVAYEKVARHNSTDSAHAYGASLGHLEAWVARRRPEGQRSDEGLQITSVTVAQVKQAATGKGGGPGTDKEAVLGAARQKWPERFDGPGRGELDYDKADACYVGLALLIQLGMATGAPPAQKAKKVNKPRRNVNARTAAVNKPRLF